MIMIDLAIVEVFFILNFRNSINYKIRTILVPDNLEAVCWEIYKPNSRNFIVFSVYRSPGSSTGTLLALKKNIQSNDNENKEL